MEENHFYYFEIMSNKEVLLHCHGVFYHKLLFLYHIKQIDRIFFGLLKHEGLNNGQKNLAFFACSTIAVALKTTTLRCYLFNRCSRFKYH